jgi:hypothetical protein
MRQGEREVEDGIWVTGMGARRFEKEGGGKGKKRVAHLLLPSLTGITGLGGPLTFVFRHLRTGHDGRRGTTRWSIQAVSVIRWAEDGGVGPGVAERGAVFYGSLHVAGGSGVGEGTSASESWSWNRSRSRSRSRSRIG